MGAIFDDISVEETEEYKKYTSSIALNNAENTEEYQEIMRDLGLASTGLYGFGVILSYGERSGMVPNGTFVVSGFENKDGKPIENADEIVNGFVVLKQVETDDDESILSETFAFKENPDKILVPFRKFREMCRDIDENDAFLEIINVRDEALTIPFVTDLMEGAEEELAELPEGSTIDSYLASLYGTSISDLGAIYTNSQGVERGTNYMLYPFRSSNLRTVFRALRRLHKRDELYKQSSAQSTPEEEGPRISR